MRRKVLGVAILMMAMLVWSSPAEAGKKPVVPEKLAGVNVISLDGLKALISSKKAGADFFLFDSRKASDFEAGRIPGAVHLPVPGKPDLGSAELDKAIKAMTGKLPSNKAAHIIFYCNGHNCWRSPKSAAAAVKMGYTNVSWLRDGLPMWKKQGYPVE